MNEQIDLISESISNFKVVSLKYKSSQAIFSEREVEPLALYFDQNSWKLLAFCRLRKEHREFLLSRIQMIKKSEIQFAPNQFSLKDHFKSDLN